MKKLAPALIFLAVTSCDKPDEAVVGSTMDPIELFQACAEEALNKTPEAQATNYGSALFMDETSVDQNGTRLELDGKGGVIASGPGKEAALRQYNACTL